MCRLSYYLNENNTFLCFCEWCVPFLFKQYSMTRSCKFPCLSLILPAIGAKSFSHPFSEKRRCSHEENLGLMVKFYRKVSKICVCLRKLTFLHKIDGFF